MLRMVKIPHWIFVSLYSSTRSERIPGQCKIYPLDNWGQFPQGWSHRISESDSSCLASVQANNEWSLPSRRYMSSGSHIEARRRSFRFGIDVECDCQVKSCIGTQKVIKPRVFEYLERANVGIQLLKWGSFESTLFCELQKYPAMKKVNWFPIYFACYCNSVLDNIYESVEWEIVLQKSHKGIGVRLIRINVGDDSRPLTLRKTIYCG
jgi:hypothetical protein